MSIYDVVALLLIVLACATALTSFFLSLDKYVEDYAHDIRKGL